MMHNRGTGYYLGGLQVQENGFSPSMMWQTISGRRMRSRIRRMLDDGMENLSRSSRLGSRGFMWR
jgi:hypothetical protein